MLWYTMKASEALSGRCGPSEGRNFNGEDGVNVWVAPEDTTDNDLVINTIQEKGWKMDVYERE